jgi:RNA polymerase sigma-70 factor (ECF subfamily)
MREGTAPSFESLYARHRALVSRRLSERGVGTDDLEDVVQETFVIVHRLLPQFEGRSSIETWLYAIARKVAANHRRKRRISASGGEPADLLSDDEEDAEALPAHVLASLSQVDDASRDLLALHEIGGLSISSLSELTGSARATIRDRLGRGEAALTRALTRRSTTPARETWLDTLTARFENPPEPVAHGALRVLSCRKTCVSSYRDLVIVVWRGPNSDEGNAVVIENLIAHAHANPGGIRFLSVVEATSTAPTREGRAMMAWGARSLAAKLNAIAINVEGSGLMRLVPPIFNACLFLGRAPLNCRYFQDLRVTLPWLAQHGELDVREVQQIIERMRSSLDPVRS